MRNPARVIISGVSSDSGKTITTLCLIAGLKSLNKSVSAFKIGPDFIDPTHHRKFTRSFNLDPVMSSEEFVKFLFLSESADFNVIEGVMGVFDGETAGVSTAKMSQILSSPIILCVDAEKLGESIRGIVKGFLKEIDIKGVVATKISSQSHKEIIKKALEKEGIELLSAIPKSAEFQFPSRHLGLYLADELETEKEKFESAFFRFFDTKKILDIFEKSKENEIDTDPGWYEKFFGPVKNKLKGKKFAFLKLKYLQFIYPENVKILDIMGAESHIIDENTISQSKKQRFDFLIIPGGYPELYGKEIEEIKREISELIGNSSSVIAECGGLEILSEKLIYEENEMPMLNVFPLSIKIEKKLQALGWRKIILPSGDELKGHEFHYGKILNQKEKIPKIFRLYDIYGNPKGEDGFLRGKFLGSWTHLYFPSNPSGILRVFRSLEEQMLEGKTSKDEGVFEPQQKHR